MSPPRLPRRLIAAAHLAGSATLVVGTFLPWLYSGQRGLDIYELGQAAHRLEIVEERWLIAPIAFVPLILVLSLLARWAGRRMLTHVLGLFAAGYTAAGALALRGTGLPSGRGIDAALLGSSVIAVGAVAELIFTTTRHRQSPAATAAPRRRAAPEPPRSKIS
ncbi:MAG: hypothetical protein JJE52_04335 [Acidimicrobiia bacterium]|nr:hypothetical protein [Acidimicrobiia bacterium]